MKKWRAIWLSLLSISSRQPRNRRVGQCGSGRGALDEVSRQLGGAKPDEEALSAVYSITK